LGTQALGEALGSPPIVNTAKAYEDYIVFVDSKAQRRRSKAKYLRQVTQARSSNLLRDKEKLRPSTLNQALVALRMFGCSTATILSETEAVETV
jgi:hypothetical protein